jgi:hypothetical protein
MRFRTAHTPDAGSPPCGLSSSAASAGDSVKDTVAEMIVEAADAPFSSATISPPGWSGSVTALRQP